MEDSGFRGGPGTGPKMGPKMPFLVIFTPFWSFLCPKWVSTPSASLCARKVFDDPKYPSGTQNGPQNGPF